MGYLDGRVDEDAQLESARRLTMGGADGRARGGSVMPVLDSLDPPLGAAGDAYRADRAATDERVLNSVSL